MGDGTPAVSVEATPAPPAATPPPTVATPTAEVEAIPVVVPTETPPAGFPTITPTSDEPATPTRRPTPTLRAGFTPPATSTGGRVVLFGPGDRLQLGGIVQFTWQSFPGASRYDLQVCREPCELSAGVWTGTGTSFGWCPGTGPFEPGTLKWRVVAQGADGRPIAASASPMRLFYWEGGCPTSDRVFGGGTSPPPPPPPPHP